MTSRLSTAVLALASLLLFGPASRAADDHGHDHGGTPEVAGPSLPRFAAVSEAYELVGVLDGKHLTLYLDRAADNEPVIDARIELEIGGTRFTAAKHGADEFEVVLAAAPAPGVLPVTAMVTVGNDADLLAGELDIHDARHAEAAVHAHSLREVAVWGAGAVVAAGALGIALRRRRAARQVSGNGGDA